MLTPAHDCPGYPPWGSASDPDWLLDAGIRSERKIRKTLSRLLRNASDVELGLKGVYQRLVDLEAKTDRTKVRSVAGLIAVVTWNVAHDIRRLRGLCVLEEFSTGDEGGAETACPDLILTSAIGSLPAASREVLTLRHVYGMAHDEIADRLGVSINAVALHTRLGIQRVTELFLHD